MPHGISRRCEECSAVKRCRLFVDHGVIVYLCWRCAKALGFEVAA